MIRTLLYLIAGLLLGGIIHIVVILTLPLLAEERIVDTVEGLIPQNRLVRLDPVAAGQPNPFGLDPALLYAVCRLDLSEGPASMRGQLPNAFWSLAIYDENGIVIYSTTNRDGIGRRLALGLFNAAQTRLLAQQQLDIEQGVLVVEARSDRLFVVVRLAPPNTAVAQRYGDALDSITCGPSP